MPLSYQAPQSTNVHFIHPTPFVSITKKALKEAEETLSMKCSLACEYKVGNTWSDTH